MISNPKYSSAADLLSYLNLNHQFEISAPIDVDKIAFLLNFQVILDSSLEEDGVIGKISFNDGKPLVRINPIQNSYTPRRRFTLAHEIGHFCLHSNQNFPEFIDSQQTMSRTESYWNPIESEANNFAAQLLIPSQLITSSSQLVIDSYKTEYNQTKMPKEDFINRMADKFIVSSKAMEYRLINVGIL